MASTFGKLEPFDPTTDKFTDYHERLGFFFEANSVTTPEKKKAIFLTSIGAQQFRLLKDLAQPDTISIKTYTELCILLKEHHEPAPPMFLQRALFESRARKSSESPQQFMVALRHLAEHCRFGTQLEERLCEKFARGINNEEVQRKLLSKSDLTLREAMKIAVATVQTSNAAKELNNHDNYPVNYSKKTPYHQKNTEKKHYQNSNRTQDFVPRVDSTRRCHRCGGPHNQKACKFKEAKCYICSKNGHIAKVCRSKSNNTNHHLDSSKGRVVLSNSKEDSDSDELNLFSLTNKSKTRCDPINVILKLTSEKGEMQEQFQVDTGAAVSVMNYQDYKHKLETNTKLEKTNIIISTYTGEQAKVYGEVVLQVTYNNETHSLPLVIIGGEGPPLLGRNWLANMKLDWHALFSITRGYTNNNLNQVLIDNEEVFGSETGLLRDHKVKIHISENAPPKFCRARHPPYTLKKGIEDELTRLLNDDIIEQVEFSDWATPIVPVVKKDKSIRICGDYKQTVNQHIEVNQYPIPLVDDLANNLARGQKFTTLDFSNAYTQLLLDSESSKLTTINTHKGLFRYKRLCFGISACPAIFQKVMDGLFAHIKNCVVYFDNLYITGKDDKEHLETLKRVLGICKQKGLRLKNSKCEFMKPEVEFVGHLINKDGLRPQPEKVKAINNAPVPTNVSELKSFLGLLNFYGKYIRNLSDILAPLHVLLQKDKSWHWGVEQQAAFTASKQALTSKQLLVHYDPSKPLILICDASPVGVGAILAQKEDDGEKPICYASRSLNRVERKYAQIDREARSLIFGIKKFHKYIYGRQITLVTDHKPLIGLFGENRPIPEQASLRIQRWAMTLSAYSYELIYRPGIQNCADALSRLPLPEADPVDDKSPNPILHLFEALEDSTLTAETIATETQADPILAQVSHNIQHGWPKVRNPIFNPFYLKKEVLNIDNNCIFWGSRVLVPQTLRTAVLDLLHEEHIGIVRMKALARCYVWWPLIDCDIEKLSKSCDICELNKNTPPKAFLHPWEWPERPWQRVHMDFAGPFLGKMFLIIVDAHSKWLDVITMNNITSENTILVLREVFATWGLPESMVSDNGPTFTSDIFKKFMAHNKVKHILSTPFHPSTNGLAERAVETFKNSMRKNVKGSVRERVAKFLTKYRSTPHSTTGVSPSELMLGRRMRTHLDLLHPSIRSHVDNEQTRQKINHDRHSRPCNIGIDDTVVVRNYRKGDKWIPGTVTEQTGPVSFKVQTQDHSIVRKHADQLRTSACGFDFPLATHSQTEPQTSPNDYYSINRGGKGVESIENVITPSIENVNIPSIENVNIPSIENENLSTTISTQNDTMNNDSIEPRRSSRYKKKPDYLEDYT